MNAMQLLTSQLRNQLKMRNPQMLKQFQNLQKNNPQEVLNNIMKDYSPEKTKQFMNFANGFGISNEQLNSYGIKAK